jgi:hypothetical protein
MWKKLFILIIAADLFFCPKLLFPILGAAIVGAFVQAWFTFNEPEHDFDGYYGESADLLPPEF